MTIRNNIGVAATRWKCYFIIFFICLSFKLICEQLQHTGWRRRQRSYRLCSFWDVIISIFRGVAPAPLWQHNATAPSGGRRQWLNVNLAFLERKMIISQKLDPCAFSGPGRVWCWSADWTWVFGLRARQATGRMGRPTFPRGPLLIGAEHKVSAMCHLMARL